MTGWRRVLVVATIGSLFLVVFLGLALGGTLDRNPEANRGEQSEQLATVENPDAAVLEPQNTWSNLAYLAAGMLILFRSGTLLGAVVGLNLGFEFLFSGLYHAKLTGITQDLDVAWIYVLLLGLSAYALQCILWPKWARQTAYPVLNAPVVITAVLAVFCAGTGILLRLLGSESTVTTLALAGVLVVLLVAGLIKARGASWRALVMPPVLAISVGVPTIFFKFSDGPEHKIFNWSNPEAVLQAHAAWHILSALLVLIAYDFFATLAGDGRMAAVDVLVVEDVVALLRRHAQRLSQSFDLPLRALHAEGPRVKRRYGICFADGSIRIRLHQVRGSDVLKYSVMVDTLCHELAHLRHFNHGRRFWQFYRRILAYAARQGIYRPGPEASLTPSTPFQALPASIQKAVPRPAPLAGQLDLFRRP